MTSQHHRENNRSMFTSKTLHFFKLIFLGEDNGKLRIPINFIRKYGKQLSNTIELEVPSGEIWPVELKKCGKRVWLEKGWRKFAKHYSLQNGSFLVFRYDGNSHFHVLIFDMSTLEIDYPRLIKEEDDDDDMSIELCDGCRKKNKMKSQYFSSPRPSKKMRTDSPHQTRTTTFNLEVLRSRTKLENREKVEKSRCSTAIGKLYVPTPAKKVVGGSSDRNNVATEVLSCGQHQLTARERAHVSRIASAFKSTGNPVFMVVMKPTFLHPKYYLGIPTSFAREFFTMQNGKLTLCNSTGKTWRVEYCCSVGNKWPNAYLRGGWRAFAEENNLNLGDVCVFELMKYPQILMKVDIHPANGSSVNQVKTGARRCLKPDPVGKKQFLTPTEKEKACNKASAFKSAIPNPCFTIVMPPAYISARGPQLSIPEQFAKRYLKRSCVVILKVSDGRTWMVDYKRNEHGRVTSRFLSRSWKAFVEENNLMVGDTCKFELINKKELLFQVFIIKE